MAILNFGGFEHGMPASVPKGAGDFVDSDGTLARGSIETSGQHDGLRSFRAEDVGGSFAGFRMATNEASAPGVALGRSTGEIYLYIWIKVNEYGTNSGVIVDMSNGIYLELAPGSSGIRVGGATQSTVKTPSEGVWFLARIRINFAGSVIGLTVDGDTEVTATTHGGNFDYFSVGMQDGMYQNDVEFDTWVLADAAIDFEPYCVRMGPNGAGNSSGWTGSYTDVDEVEQDDDTTYLSTASSGAKHDVALESAASAGVVGSIKAIKPLAVCRDEGGVANVETYVRVNGTDYEQGQDIDPGTSYIPIADVLETNPDTAAAWTSSDLDGLGVGVKSNAAVAARVTTLCVMVLTDGVAGSPSEQVSYGWFNDDGNEAASTLKATQGTDPASMIAGDTVRVRIQTDTNGVDPPTRAAKLQYRRVGVTAWRDVPLA